MWNGLHFGGGLGSTAYPAYGAWTYVNGQSVGNVTGVFTKGLTPADIEEEALAFVVGQGQQRCYWGVGIPLSRFLPPVLQLCLPSVQ